MTADTMSVAAALESPHQFAQEAHLLRRQGIDPHPAIAEYAALVARCEQAEAERNRLISSLQEAAEYNLPGSEIRRLLAEAVDDPPTYLSTRPHLGDTYANAARVAELEAALAVYADHRHWGIQRDEYRHAKLVWIGPGSTDTVPDGPKIARAALASTPDGQQDDA